MKIECWKIDKLVNFQYVKCSPIRKVNFINIQSNRYFSIFKIDFGNSYLYVNGVCNYNIESQLEN